MLFSAACVNNGPIIRTGVTPEPTEAPAILTPEPSGAPATDEPTDAPPDPDSEFDELGLRISGAEHFIRYIVFKDIVVYEEAGDTFLDGIAENNYPETIACAVDVVYYDEFGREIARARLQMRDGSYLLLLAPGENAILARIPTDMTLTDKEFKLEFKMDTGIKPVRI